MKAAKLLVSVALMTATAACNIVSNQPDLNGLDVRVTFLHTTDIHSRLLPYKLAVPLTDRNLGLKDENAPFGGAARMAYIIRRERQNADRSLYVDTGDVSQGAPIYNVFRGEAEFKALSMMGLDVMVIGNHEFDQGEPNVADKIARYADFPVLAANYKFTSPPPPLADLLNDYEIFNLKGLRIGVIGLGNTSSMSTLIGAGNKLGITAMDAAETTQFLIDFIKPMVDVIVVASHLGLTGDEELIKNTTGIDIVLGGHHHIVLSPPKSTIRDCQIQQMNDVWRERFVANHDCQPREVVLAHSGAFAKYVGRLDVVFAQADDGDWEVKSFKYKAIPVDATVPQDDLVKEMLEPYVDNMNQVMQLDRVLGYAPIKVRRFGTQGGDSQLGNLVADSMRKRKGVETDFALTNTLGIRTDINPGPVTVDDMYNVFPFENTITTMYLSGSEVVELFDFVARRTASRGCKSQAQISGARVVLQCGRCDLSVRPVEWQEREQIKVSEDAEGCALAIEILGEPISLDGQYQLAANNYIAGGGSGFNVLKRNTTQIDTGIPQRDALMDSMRQGEPCRTSSATVCTRDSDCGNAKYVCGCPERSEWNGQAGTCDGAMECPPAGGTCILAACIDDVWGLFSRDCPAQDPSMPLSKCRCDQKTRAMAQCEFTSCINDENGAIEDGRIRVIPP
ncbi:MAG: bifunctional metallophosphatase/5'-nucleotidase [Deltaproteobacteria bacterium]|nr:bifunctional metallophosphatase/5'-nucleotidase [Deltaproteobacteria bacterium]